MLVLTALEDLTADWVIEVLNERGIRVARVDPADIGPRLLFSARISPEAGAWAGRLRTTSREVGLQHVGAVYYRRPGAWRFEYLPPQQRDFAIAEARHGLGGVLYNLDGALYVNHPAAVTRADFKPGQLRIAVGLGLAIPPTLVTNDVGEARRFAAEHGRVICKTFRGLPAGEDGHAAAIWAQRVDPDTFDDSLAVTAHLFQAEVRKTGDVRVTVVGGRVFAQHIAAPDRTLDWRRGDWGQLIHSPIVVPPARDWVFIECNPNGQWGWLPGAGQIAIAFADLLSRKDCGT